MGYGIRHSEVISTLVGFPATWDHLFDLEATGSVKRGPARPSHPNQARASLGFLVRVSASGVCLRLTFFWTLLWNK